MEVTDVASVRDGTVGQINDVSLALLSEAAAAMDNYASFLTSFNYEAKNYSFAGLSRRSSRT